MATTKPQPIDPKQVKQFLADAKKKCVAARKNLAIDEETAYQLLIRPCSKRPWL